MARLRKRDYVPLLTRGFFIALLVGVTFLFARGAVRMYGRYAEASTASKAAEIQLQDLKDRKQELKLDTDRLSSPRGLEEELRKRYGVALPGEGVIELISNTNASSTEARPSMVRRWLNWLF